MIFFVGLVFLWLGHLHTLDDDTILAKWTWAVLLELVFAVILAVIGLFAVPLLDAFFSLARHF